VRRRTLLAATATGICLSGCLSLAGDGPADTAESPTRSETETEAPGRHTANGVTATFRVVDGHEPTDDTASATFDDTAVTVAGTMDPAGCNRPVLSTLRYSATDGVAYLTVGAESPYESTRDVECGNASFDYRCELAVDDSRPEGVEVRHDYGRKEDRSFTLERD
jgi:hypothetical protein